MDARDHQAIELIRQGQQRLIEANHILVERYSQTVIHHCQFFLPEREAQKIAEQTFKEVLLGSFEGVSIRISLLTIATRLSKARAQVLPIALFTDPTNRSSGDPLSQKEKEEYALLNLRHRLQLPWKVIAEIMSISSAAAARNRYSRLLKRLRESKYGRQAT